MIVVIADDFTGAAELGGIGLKYGLTVEVNTKVNVHSTADLLIIATDTRSLKIKGALAIMEKITRQVALLKPQLVFKKVDSVLRGHVVPELMTHLEVLNRIGAILAPANPALGRTISNGKYFINGRPLHLSGFANDPDFPAKTSSVRDMLDYGNVPVIVQQNNEALKHAGIIVAEAETEADLQEWAVKADEGWLLAGGSGFFSAVLKNKYGEPGEPPEQQGQKAPLLMVCGTTFFKSVESIARLKHKGGWVSYMPEEMMYETESVDDLFAAWCAEIVSFVNSFGKAIIAVDADMARRYEATPTDIRNKISIVVKKALEQVSIGELLIEGGSTAFAVLKQINCTTFFPVEEVSPGVIKMIMAGRDGQHLTIKPGSYNWPPHIEETNLQ